MTMFSSNLASLGESLEGWDGWRGEICSKCSMLDPPMLIDHKCTDQGMTVAKPCLMPSAL